MIRVDVSNQHPSKSVPVKRLQAAVKSALASGGVTSAEISVAVVDDGTIHELNRRHLQHDYPTDVLSFLLDCRDGHIDAEIVVSADTAAASASRFGWRCEDELLLYAIHGALHLTGLDDHLADDRAEMRRRECEVLREFDLEPNYDESESATVRVRAATGGDSP